MKTKIIIGLAVAGSLTPATLPIPIYAAYADDAKECIERAGKELVNTCSYTIAVAWCAEGAGGSCANGFTAIANFSPGKRMIHAGSAGGHVEWGACEGASTIVTYGYKKLEYGCR